MTQRGTIGVNANLGFHHDLIKATHFRYLPRENGNGVGYVDMPFKIPNNPPALGDMPAAELGITEDGIPTKFPDPAGIYSAARLYLLWDLHLSNGMNHMPGEWDFYCTPNFDWEINNGSGATILTRDKAAGTARVLIPDLSTRLYIELVGMVGAPKTFPPPEDFFFNAFPAGTSVADREKWVHPGYNAYYNQFGSDTAEPGFLRMMEPYKVNGGGNLLPITTLPSKKSLTWWGQHGFYPPIELLVEASVACGMKPWANMIPNLETKAIVQEVATNALAVLPQGLAMGWEESNEVWNPKFGQYYRNGDQARVYYNLPYTAVNGVETSTSKQVYSLFGPHHAMKAKEKLLWVREVFENAGRGADFRGILSWQSVVGINVWRDMLLNRLASDGTDSGIAVWEVLYGVAIAPYNAHSLGKYNSTEYFSKADRDLLFTNKALFKDRAFEALNGGYFQRNVDTWNNFAKNIRTLCAEFGLPRDRLRLMAYEIAPQHIAVDFAEGGAVRVPSQPSNVSYTDWRNSMTQAERDSHDYLLAARTAFREMLSDDRMGELMVRQFDTFRDADADLVTYQGPNGAWEDSFMDHGVWNIGQSITDFDGQPGKALFDYIENPPVRVQGRILKGLAG